jgi:hypothetical protein
MGFSGKVLELQQMLNQIQTTLAIEILYYLIVNAIKISILFFYLRIGNIQCSQQEDIADQFHSC